MGCDEMGSEAIRIAVLKSYDVLDTPSEPEFDDICREAAEVAGVPIAMISLIDSDRQWIKARVGVDVSESPRCFAFCNYTIKRADVMTVPDATEDERFADNPFVTGEAHLRFYAGAPLEAPGGSRIGALCVIDRKSRPMLSIAQCDALMGLAARTMRMLEQRRRRPAHPVEFAW